MPAKDPYKQAQKAVNAKKGFYYHFAIFVIINVFLYFINYLTSYQIWFVYPLLGTSLILAFHYLFVFGIPFTNVLGKEWEEKEIEKELLRIKIKEKQRLLESGSLEELPEEEQLDLKELEKKYDDLDLV